LEVKTICMGSPQEGAGGGTRTLTCAKSGTHRTPRAQGRKRDCD